MSFTRNKSIIIGVPLERTNMIRDLAVVLDSKLLFDEHINGVVRSSNRMLGYIMGQFRLFSDKHAIFALYYASIYIADSTLPLLYGILTVPPIFSEWRKFKRNV